MRAFAVAPQDPMVLFSIAMAHLHRAMQRQTNNRHLQIVQGLSYLIDYYRARVGSSKGKPTAWAEAQEANYNVGRAFHMLGLPTLAAKYYESALAVELPLADDDEPARTYSLQKVVAYNLQLVYVMSGNFRLARKIIDEYLVI
jgi:general transcription factor 3C polypeptide 3 (transcription factor C subunit 4)